MKSRFKIAIVVLLLCMLTAFLYWWGGDGEELHGWDVKTETVEVNSNRQEMTAKPPENDEPPATPEVEQQEEAEAVVEQNYEPATGAASENIIVEEKPQTPPEVSDLPEAQALPDDSSEKEPEAEEKLYCTLSVRCDTALGRENTGHLPGGGVIYTAKEVEFFQGETVFNILVREMKQNGIHLEFVNVPIYNSAYIEGISNLYEFDCGELSGWMYKVNGVYPQFGCSQYVLNPGDCVEWLYTCNSGEDIGGSNFYGNGMKRDEF